MASEIRVDKINSLSGVGTVTLSPTGVDIAGITTAATLRATTGIVTSLTAGSLTSLGAISGTTGTFSSHVSLGDSDELRFGDSNDLVIQHDGTNSIITNGTGQLSIRGNDIRLLNNGASKALIKGLDGGAAELYYDGTKKLETSSSGVTVTGGLTATTGTFTGAVTLADGLANSLKIGAGEDLVLQHNGTDSFIDNNTGDLYIQTTGSGDDILIESADDITLKVAGSETAIQATGDGAVELYHNNVKKIETAEEGVVIPSGGGNCLRVFGQNTAHATSALIIGQNSTTVSQLRAYGPDASTNGKIEFRSSRSDASNTVNLIYDSGNLEFTSGYGIAFNATSDASGVDNELFDDYEEGSFTFTKRGFAGGFDSNYALANQTGKYTKIGRVVTLKGGFNLTGNSGNIAATDYFTVYMSSLPFAMDDTSSGYTGAIISHQGEWWAYTSLGGGSNAKGSVVAVYNDYLSFYCTSVTGSPVRNSNEITFTITYTST